MLCVTRNSIIFLLYRDFGVGHLECNRLKCDGDNKKKRPEDPGLIKKSLILSVYIPAACALGISSVASSFVFTAVQIAE